MKSPFYVPCFHWLAFVLAASMLTTLSGAASATSQPLPESADPTEEAERVASPAFQSWKGTHFGAPRGLQPVDAPEPQLGDAEHAKRSFELSVQILASQKLCSSRIERCHNQPGFGAYASMLKREDAHFAWGVSGQFSRFTEVLSSRDAEARFQNRGLAGILFGRLSLLASGALDPFIQAGFGGGEFNLRGHLRVANEVQVTSVSTFAPIYQAAAGLDFHAAEMLTMGAAFSWTHWLLSDFERCSQVAFGVCGVPGPGRFDLENAVWSVGITTTVSFGQSL